MRDVYVAGVGMTRFAKQPDRSLKDLTAEAVNAAMKNAGQIVGEVQSCYFGNAVAGSITGQEMLAGQFLLRPLGFGGIPVFNVENACAWPPPPSTWPGRPSRRAYMMPCSRSGPRR